MSAQARPAAKRHRMLLGNRDVSVAIRKLLFKFNKTAAFPHGGGNRVKRLVGGSHIAHPAAEDLRIGGMRGVSGFRKNPHLRIKGRDTVIKRRIGFSRGVAVPFLRFDVQHHRTREISEVFQNMHEFGKVMTVNGTEVIEVKGGKDGRRRT